MDGFSPHASLSSIVQACITVSIIHIRCYSTGYLCNNTQEASLIILGKKLNFSNFTFFPQLIYRSLSFVSCSTEILLKKIKKDLNPRL